MQYKLFVESTNAEYIFDCSERQPVGDLHTLLASGEEENAIYAAPDSFFCRIENREATDIAMLVRDPSKLDIEAENVEVTDLRISRDDTIVASLKATFTVELADEWTSGAQVSEWIRDHPRVLDCFVTYLLITEPSYNSLCEAAFSEKCSVTALPVEMLQG